MDQSFFVPSLRRKTRKTRWTKNVPKRNSLKAIGVLVFKKGKKKLQVSSDRIKAVIKTLVRSIRLCKGMILLPRNYRDYSKKHEVNGSLLTNQYFNGMSRTSGNDAALGGESHHKETRIQTPRLP